MTFINFCEKFLEGIISDMEIFIRRSLLLHDFSKK